MLSPDAKKTFARAWSNLSFTDKILPLAIILSIVLGVLLSVFVPTSRDAFDGVEIVGVSVPLAVGMIVMMIPPLCKVEWENLHVMIRQGKYLKHIIISLVLNWIVCPFIMFGLAWLTLFDLPEYRIGIIMIGLARCIAMVMVWNEIAGGDHNLCAILVLMNSVLQIALYAPYQMFFCYVITGDSKGSTMTPYSFVAKSVAFFLGVPLGFGLLIRLFAYFIIGIEKFKAKILPFISPWAFIGLMYTIIVIFIQRGNAFIKDIRSALRCFVPLLVYFIVCWFGTFFLVRWLMGGVQPHLESNGVTSDQTHDQDFVDGLDEKEPLLCGCEEKIRNGEGGIQRHCSAKYAEVITQTFTAASNNFELSLAIAIAIYGSGSKQSIAATFGPLLEVPVLLLLCFVAVWTRYKFMWNDKADVAQNGNC